MWLLADLFHDLPEVGDIDKPKLVFFFDEAHLLFDDASKAFLDADRPDRAVDPLQGRRHLLRHPEPERRARRRTGASWDRGCSTSCARIRRTTPRRSSRPSPRSPSRTTTSPRRSQQLGHRRGDRHGDGSGRVHRLRSPGLRMRAPESLMAPTPDEVLRPGIAASALMAKYGPAARSGLRVRETCPRVAGGRRGGGAQSVWRGGCGRRQAAAEKERARAEAQAEA